MLEKSHQRAKRRHHHFRMLEKVKHFSFYNYFWGDETEKEQHQKRTAENRKPCSCHMCGNPRKHSKDKLTIQEKKNKLDNYLDFC